MFIVESYNICPITGITDFVIKFDIGTGRVVTDKRGYYDRQDADKYIIGIKRSYILDLFGRYVYHAIILNETGTRSFYATPERMESLDICQRANQYFQEESINAICTYILQIEKHLRRILPSPGNKSRQSSDDKLLEMIMFSKQVCKSINKIKEVEA